MKVLCSPASFKESLSAAKAAQAICAGVNRADPAIQCEVCPVADGGEGTLDTLLGALGGDIIEMVVMGPLGQPVKSRFGLAGGEDMAVIELAQASGLELVPPHLRDPARATTFGTGQLIDGAIQHGHRSGGCRSMMVCVGGSATVDGGGGLAQALGARFFDSAGRLIEQPMCGGLLMNVHRIDPPDPARLPPIEVACDVDNPLCGSEGAALVYGPQKGASPTQVVMLDKALVHLAEVCARSGCMADPDAPGMGAAGGAAFGLAALCGAKLRPGIDLVLDAIGFARRCDGASLVITGEGRLDGQSLRGKACMGVAAAAAKLGVPAIAIVGSAGPGVELCIDPARNGSLARYISLSERYGQQRALQSPAALLEQAAFELMKEF